MNILKSLLFILFKKYVTIQFYNGSSDLYIQMIDGQYSYYIGDDMWDLRNSAKFPAIKKTISLLFKGYKITDISV